jgi:hypothetical protein
MLKNNKRIEPGSSLKWDDKIVQVWFKHSKNEILSENERELYFWLATNRYNIFKISLGWRNIQFMFWHDTKAKTTSN